MRDYHLHLVLVCTMYIFCKWRNHGVRYGLRVNGKIFKRWYEENKEFDRADDFPDFMTNWTKSWLKYHNKYCVTQNKYFVYPYNSYTTCFSEAGEHSVVVFSNFQVPMMFGNIENA